MERAPLKLLESYLSGRRQRVHLDNKQPSPWSEPVEWAVPQGSVLGPLLFSLYCADIGESVQAADIVMFADDVTLVVGGATQVEARHRMNTALAQFHAWATANRLAPQPSKTQLLSLTSYPKADTMQNRFAQWHARQNVTCTMAGEIINPLSDIKILGTLIDDQLSWEAQAAAMSRKARGAMGAVSRHGRYLPKPDRVFLMRALALPYLDYCQTALAAPSAAARETLRRAYNRAVRIAVRCPGPWVRDAAGKPKGRSDAALVTAQQPTYARRRAAVAAAGCVLATAAVGLAALTAGGGGGGERARS